MHKEMAEQNTIIRAVTGSTAHGLNLPGTDDRDEMGVCVEDLSAFAGFNEFEQYIYRTASEREGGKNDAPSQPGDLDLCIYSLRKFLRLAIQGNPSVLLLLFVKDYVQVDARGTQMQDMAQYIISKQAGKRFLGYMESQRQRLLGERGQKKVNRPDLEAKYGYDTKYAMHLLRLGFQGVELLETGKLSLPMTEPTRSWLMQVRTGEVELNDVLGKAGELERRLKDLLTEAPVRDEPDTATVQDWMTNMYLQNWKAREHRYTFYHMPEKVKHGKNADES